MAEIFSFSRRGRGEKGERIGDSPLFLHACSPGPVISARRSRIRDGSFELIAGVLWAGGNIYWLGDASGVAFVGQMAGNAHGIRGLAKPLCDLCGLCAKPEGLGRAVMLLVSRGERGGPRRRGGTAFVCRSSEVCPPFPFTTLESFWL